MLLQWKKKLQSFCLIIKSNNTFYLQQNNKGMRFSAYLCSYFITLVFPFLATYLPPVSIGTSLEPDWKLIGTSP